MRNPNSEKWYFYVTRQPGESKLKPMQLAYIWIEDYLNLKNCGILLSSRIRVNQEVDKNQRTFSISISDNNKHIDDFFGKNVAEVTTIVGANGVGKSNLIDYLFTFLQAKGYYDENWLALLYNEDYKTFEVVDALFTRERTRKNTSRIQNAWKIIITNTSSYEVKKPVRAFGKTYNSLGGSYQAGKFAAGLGGMPIYYSPFLDFRNFADIAGYRSLNDISTNYLIEHDADDQHSENDKVEIHKYKNVERQFVFVQENLDFVREVKLPTEITVRFTKVVSNDEIRQDDHGFRTKDFYKKLRDSASSKWNMVPNHLMHKGREEGSGELYLKGMRIKIKWWFVINFITNFLHNYSYVVDLSDTKFKVSSELAEFDFKKEDPVQLVKKFFAIHTFFKKNEFDPVSFIDEICGIIDEEADVTSVNEENESWFIVKPETGMRILALHRQYIACFKDKSGRKGFLNVDWRTMSSGEKAFLDLFSRVYWGLKRLNVMAGDFLYLLLDEGEAGFHPLWQRKYFSYLLRFLSIFPGVRFHLILTTHSPFIISDLPMENLVLLRSDKQGLCQVETKFESIKESFAANIHQLLTDAFFMEEGPIGAFATEKINEIFIMNSKQPPVTLPIIKKMIEKIGEPLIKLKLQEKFHEMFAELPEEQRLQMQIDEMTQRMNELKGGKQ